MRALINIRFDVAKKLIGQVDFPHLTLFYIDDVQHFFWDQQETVLLPLWQLIDRKLKDLLEAHFSCLNVFIMSDHGFVELKRVFCVNRWLAEEGYLALQDHLEEDRKDKAEPSTLPRANEPVRLLTRKTRSLLLKLAHHFVKTIVWEKMKAVIPFEVRAKIRGTIGYLENERTHSFTHNPAYDSRFVDFKKTKVLAGGEGLIYINQLIMNKEEQTKLQAELISKLKGLKYPGTDRLF